MTLKLTIPQTPSSRPSTSNGQSWNGRDGMMGRGLPDAFANALGKIVSDERQAWARDRELFQAEQRALIADLRRETTEHMVQLRAGIDVQVLRIDQALANVKNGEPGPPGRDADFDIIGEMVADAIAQLPPAEKGEPGKDADPALIADLVKRAIADLPPATPGEPGRDGVDGRSIEIEAVKAMVNLAVKDAVAALPVPQDGRDGVDGKDGVDGQPGEPGIDGKDGSDGEPGKDGRDGLDGKNGADGAPGAPGIAGKDGADGEPGKDGRDGIGLADAFIDRSGLLVLTLTNGEARTFGEIMGKDGAPGQPGRDGQDGVGFDDLEFTSDGGRNFMVRFVKGERIKEFPFRLPVVLDAGIWNPEKAYEKGDAVSFGGSIWIAQEDTRQKPEHGGSWRLGVKHGRDGKAGKDGAKGDPGEPGRSGRDLRDLGVT